MKTKTKMKENKEISDLQKRILAFMLYKGYIGENSISVEQLEEDMLKEGWLDISDEQILALLKSKDLL
jgi:hypothetical protein